MATGGRRPSRAPGSSCLRGGARHPPCPWRGCIHRVVPAGAAVPLSRLPSQVTVASPSAIAEARARERSDDGPIPRQRDLQLVSGREKGATRVHVAPVVATNEPGRSGPPRERGRGSAPRPGRPPGCRRHPPRRSVADDLRLLEVARCREQRADRAAVRSEEVGVGADGSRAGRTRHPSARPRTSGRAAGGRVDGPGERPGIADRSMSLAWTPRELRVPAHPVAVRIDRDGPVRVLRVAGRELDRDSGAEVRLVDGAVVRRVGHVVAPVSSTSSRRGRG